MLIIQNWKPPLEALELLQNLIEMRSQVLIFAEQYRMYNIAPGGFRWNTCSSVRERENSLKIHKNLVAV